MSVDDCKEWIDTELDNIEAELNQLEREWDYEADEKLQEILDVLGPQIKEIYDEYNRRK